MERIVFDGRPNPHPASLDGLAERTITVGSAAKELRMIGWRVGWVVGPAEAIADVTLVGLTNVVCQVGIAQAAVALALEHPDGAADVAAATAELERRRDAVLEQLRGLPVVPPAGGWSLLVDTRALGLEPAEASARLLELGRVAATPMDGWGPSAGAYLRLVYANEPVERLATLRARFDDALGTRA